MTIHASNPSLGSIKRALPLPKVNLSCKVPKNMLIRTFLFIIALATLTCCMTPSLGYYKYKTSSEAEKLKFLGQIPYATLPEHIKPQAILSFDRTKYLAYCYEAFSITEWNKEHLYDSKCIKIPEDYDTLEYDLLVFLVNRNTNKVEYLQYYCRPGMTFSIFNWSTGEVIKESWDLKAKAWISELIDSLH